MIEIRLTNNITTTKYFIDMFGISFITDTKDKNIKYDKNQLVMLSIKINNQKERESFVEELKEKLDIKIGLMLTNVCLYLGEILEEEPTIRENGIMFKFKPQLVEALYNHDIHSLQLF